MVGSELRNMQLESDDGQEMKKKGTNVTKPWVYYSCHALSWEAFDPLSKKWMHRSTNDHPC